MKLFIKTNIRKTEAVVKGGYLWQHVEDGIVSEVKDEAKAKRIMAGYDAIEISDVKYNQLLGLVQPEPKPAPKPKQKTAEKEE
jgi:hypothetical protein